MKRKKGLRERLRDTDWSVVAGILGVILLMSVAFGIPMVQSCENKDKPQEELLRTEEFTYKGHQYIKFKGHDMLGTGSVVHDPNCDCQNKKDSI